MILGGKARNVATHTQTGPVIEWTVGGKTFSRQSSAACQAAFGIYANRLKHYLGAYQWLLDGADAIIFTNDVGMRSWKLRQEACSGAESLGLLLDEDANRRAPANEAARVSRPDSRTQIWLIPTDEELVIVGEVLAQLR